MICANVYPIKWVHIENGYLSGARGDTALCVRKRKKATMTNPLPTDTQPSEPLSRREARAERRAARAAANSGATWIAGVILILLGIAFLMQNMGALTFPLDNWWALFILIPAIGAFDKGWRLYRAADNQLTAAARGSLLTGLILLLVTAAFLFEFSWLSFGPALIILAGIGILINALLPSE